MDTDQDDREYISIHALLAESDRRAHVAAVARCQFLSTLSLRRATIQAEAAVLMPPISIHALLAESDSRCLAGHGSGNHFYPRSPCGERRQGQRIGQPPAVFLSTLSLRRATQGGHIAAELVGISIHALLAESDRTLTAANITPAYFYPRSPCGERPGTPPPQTPR